MATVLRSAKFDGERARLEIRECADRTQIQILLEAGRPDDSGDFLITLSASEWSQLINVPFLDQTKFKCHEPPPDNFVETLTFVDEHTILEIRELAGGSSIIIAMNRIDKLPQDEAWIELTPKRWRYLRDLDYVSYEPPEPAGDAPSHSDQRFTD